MKAIPSRRFSQKACCKAKAYLVDNENELTQISYRRINRALETDV